jgi:hypothetical protein
MERQSWRQTYRASLNKKLVTLLNMRFKYAPCIALLIALTHCKLAEQREKPSTPAPAPKAVLFYLVSEQYALGSVALESGLSKMVAQGIVASSDSNFNRWTTPALKCMYSEEDGVDIKNFRALDVGDLKLSGYHLNETTIPKGEKNYGFSASGSLAKGEEYEFETTGTASAQLSWRQKFNIPQAGANIRFKSADTDPEYTSPSPALVGSSDPHFLVTIKRNEKLTLSYEAPAGTTYVKVSFSDGTTATQSNITCYGSPAGPIEVPAGAFRYFKETADGIMTLDFVSVYRKLDAPKINESVVLSYTRHLHGRRDFNLESGKQAVQFGQLIFQ